MKTPYPEVGHETQEYDLTIPAAKTFNLLMFFFILTFQVLNFRNIVKSYSWVSWPTSWKYFFSLVLGSWDHLKEIWPPGPSWKFQQNFLEFFYLCENLLRAWELLFSTKVHTGYVNMHAKNYYSCPSHLATNYHFLQNLSYFDCQ